MAEQDHQGCIRVCQLYLYYLPTFSGAALRHNRLAAEVQQRGHRVFVLTPKWNSLCSHEVINGVSVYRLPLLPIGPQFLRMLVFGIMLTFSLIARRSTFDILHTLNYDVSLLPALLTAKLLGKRVIVEKTLMRATAHIAGEGWKPRAHRLRLALERRVLHWWDGFVAISTPLRGAMVKDGVPSDRIAILPPSVDTDQFRPAEPSVRRKTREALGYQPDEVVICMVGAIIPRKGVDVILQAIVRLLARNPHCRLLLVGPYERSSGALGSLIDGLIEELAAPGIVRVTGRVDGAQIVEYLQAADVFAFPSRREGFGNALIEGMATGLPCVTAEMDGIAYDIVDPGQTGIVLTSCEPEEWALQLEELARDVELRVRLGTAARKEMVGRFARKAAVDRQIAYYRKVLGGSAH